jgi:hypothetical protein
VGEVDAGMHDDEVATPQQGVDASLRDPRREELPARDDPVLHPEEIGDSVEVCRERHGGRHALRLPRRAAADAGPGPPVDSSAGKVVLDMSRRPSPVSAQASLLERDARGCSSASLSRVGTTKR